MAGVGEQDRAERGGVGKAAWGGKKKKGGGGGGRGTGGGGGMGGGVGVLRCYKLLKLFYALKRFSSHLELPVEHWCPVADIKYLFLSG